MRQTKFNREPFVRVEGYDREAWRGWEAVADRLARAARRRSAQPVVVVECYTGVQEGEIVECLSRTLRPAAVVRSREAMRPADEVRRLVDAHLTADPVFGKLSEAGLEEFFDPAARCAAAERVAAAEGPVLVVGAGASLLAEGDLLVYADMPRWEHQLRFRRDEAANLAADNHRDRAADQYRRAYFVDWRVCDRHKREQMARWDFVLDTTRQADPRLVTGAAYRAGLAQAAARPFSVVPFFDPGVWGGQWMRDVCGLDEAAYGYDGDEPPPNYAWCFNCVPEENSLLLRFGDVVVETPAHNLVLDQPDALLGTEVRRRFGGEFPIRFDFLDTIDGTNLSLQVHPLGEYMREHFGHRLTQDESYYLMDVRDEAIVYLGLKEGCDPEAFARELQKGQENGHHPEVDRYVNSWPVRKHDHLSIPAGTIHCSGRGCMVLEISATPYIFTFKLWDWGRLDLDGRPRPIHLDRGLANMRWERDTGWVGERLVNPVEVLRCEPGLREERTGLDALQFIETRRHWFTRPVEHDTRGSVDVVCLVEGDAALVESPDGAFEPFRVNYAEVFIVPAAVGPYTIRPLGTPGEPLATLKATVRDA